MEKLYSIYKVFAMIRGEGFNFSNKRRLCMIESLNRFETFDFESYEPRPWDLITCYDESEFFITNGFFGPTAWVLQGPTPDSSMVFLSYQGLTLKEVVQEIHENHGIKKVLNGKRKVFRRIIKTNIGI